MSERIPEGWCAEELGNLAKKIEGGGTPSRNEPSFWGGSIPWATVKDLRGTALCNTQESITEAGLENSSSKLIPANTLILACRMAVGKAVFFDRDVAINQDLKAFYPRSDVDWRFLLQWYVSKSHVIEGLATGSTVKGIRLENLKTLPINTPPLPEQKKIAAILSSVDEVIEKTRAQIDKLKDLKTGMMQELLIQGIGHTEFKDSPVGRIPASWGIVKIADCTSRFYQGINTVADNIEYVKEGVPIIQAKHMTSGSLNLSNARSVACCDYEKYKGKFQPLKSDILFSNIGTIGKSVIIDGCDNFLIAWNVFLMSVDKNVMPKYMHYTLQYLDWLNFYDDLMTGNATKFVNKSALGSILIRVPPLEEQEKISDTISSLDNRLRYCEQRIGSLGRIKKALMQDLLTGKVRVQVDAPETAEA